MTVDAARAQTGRIHCPTWRCAPKARSAPRAGASPSEKLGGIRLGQPFDEFCKHGRDYRGRLRRKAEVTSFQRFFAGGGHYLCHLSPARFPIAQQRIFQLSSSRGPIGQRHRPTSHRQSGLRSSLGDFHSRQDLRKIFSRRFAGGPWRSKASQGWARSFRGLGSGFSKPQRSAPREFCGSNFCSRGLSGQGAPPGFF